MCLSVAILKLAASKGCPSTWVRFTSQRWFRKILQGNTDTATSHALAFLESKGVALAGASCAGLVAAVNVGEALGYKAHEFFGERRQKRSRSAIQYSASPT
jgi:hypothetical protein